MKQKKLIKMLAMIMVAVMMLSSSVFAAGNEGANEGIEPASVNDEYISSSIQDTISTQYNAIDGIRRTVRFTAKCQYGLVLMTDMGYCYFDYARFDPITDAVVDQYTSVSMSENLQEEQGDDSQQYMDYRLGNQSTVIRVYVTCDAYANVDMYATQVQ